jgi:hypothetical protein
MSSIQYVLSSKADLSESSRENPFAEGTFRYASLGIFTDGPRCGEAAVFKFFKTGSVYEKDFFRLDIKAQDYAIPIVSEFQKLNAFTIPIQVSRARVFTNISSREKYLVEPYIENWQKFNSNTGWFCDSGDDSWSSVMQALSHFSYHSTGGGYLLCDLQGGIYEDKIVLSDPVIMSRDGRFGVTDLGLRGIENFFAKHQCNSFCCRTWALPKNCRHWSQAEKGTRMRMRNKIKFPPNEELFVL